MPEHTTRRETLKRGLAAASLLALLPDWAILDPELFFELRKKEALEPIGGDRGEIDEPLAAGFDDAAHPMPHAENTFHVTGISEAGSQAFDNSGQRLVDHRGRPA